MRAVKRVETWRRLFDLLMEQGEVVVIRRRQKAVELELLRKTTIRGLRLTDHQVLDEELCRMLHVRPPCTG
jgi:hypothetical protein